MTAFFALATSLLWGLADFGGGLLTRRSPALTVVVVSQSIAALVLGVIVVATGGWSEAGPQLWFAVAAGLVGPVALLSFYKALALGPMGVVSPLATLSVAVPIGVGLVLGERPGLLQVAGIAVAVGGVVLAGGPQLGGAAVQRRTIGLTLVAALGFGTVFALIAEASTTVTGLFLALFVQRVTNVAAGGAALYASARRGGAVLPAGGFPWAALPALAFVGLADVAANGTYSVAAQHGPVTVAAVLASLYPVVTALA
ncbi:DMT family transporter, partial [Streptomyces sp. SID8499]|uniref:EamA family transporter n=2 Tax=Streptomyces TaxID=1883 RepID=UPI0013C77750|nr:DMT family transporter [Streptomyces sp. SID8499]